MEGANHTISQAEGIPEDKQVTPLGVTPRPTAILLSDSQRSLVKAQ